MKKYIKRSTIVEAIQIPTSPDESTAQEIKEWIISKGDQLKSSNVVLIRGRTVIAFTIQGTFNINPGDFLVRDDDGMWKVLSRAKFMTEYDSAPEADYKHTTERNLDSAQTHTTVCAEKWIKAFRVYYYGEHANVRMVEKWADDRWPNPHRAAEMSQFFIDTERALEWHNRAPNVDAKTLNKWATVFQLHEIPKCGWVGTWNPHVAKKWIDAGWQDSDIAKQWSKYVDDPKLAFVLYECGLRLPRHLTRKPDNA